MLKSKCAATGQDGGQVGIAVAVAVTHAAAKEHHRSVEQRVFAIADGDELVEEVGELLGDERVAFTQTRHELSHHNGDPEIMARLSKSGIWAIKA